MHTHVNTHILSHAYIKPKTQQERQSKQLSPGPEPNWPGPIKIGKRRLLESWQMESGQKTQRQRTSQGPTEPSRWFSLTLTWAACSICWRRSRKASPWAVVSSTRSWKDLCNSFRSLSICRFCWGDKSWACSEIKNWISKASASVGISSQPWAVSSPKGDEERKKRGKKLPILYRSRNWWF